MSHQYSSNELPTVHESHPTIVTDGSNSPSIKIVEPLQKTTTRASNTTSVDDSPRGRVNPSDNTNSPQPTGSGRRSSLAAFTERLRSGSRSRSRSRSRNSGEQVRGPYADIANAQYDYMDKLREEQEKNNVKVNADGIPLPPKDGLGRRRSSVTHALGLDKPLLSR